MVIYPRNRKDTDEHQHFPLDPPLQTPTGGRSLACSGSPS